MIIKFSQFLHVFPFKVMILCCQIGFTRGYVHQPNSGILAIYRMGLPPDISWFINHEITPSNYSYIYLIKPLKKAT